MHRLELAVGQISAARQYTLSLLDELTDADWFWQPREGVTHIAWQVGHLAAAEYFLTLQRIRGQHEDDVELIPADFFEQFGRGSTPKVDPSKYAKSQEIRCVLDQVHQRAMEEMKDLSADILDQPTDPPHPMFTTKIGALLFCPQHEMVHAGQIGLLRRLMGKAPLR